MIAPTNREWFMAAIEFEREWWLNDDKFSLLYRIDLSQNSVEQWNPFADSGPNDTGYWTVEDFLEAVIDGQFVPVI